MRCSLRSFGVTDGRKNIRGGGRWSVGVNWNEVDWSTRWGCDNIRLTLTGEPEHWAVLNNSTVMSILNARRLRRWQVDCGTKICRFECPVTSSKARKLLRDEYEEWLFRWGSSIWIPLKTHPVQSKSFKAWLISQSHGVMDSSQIRQVGRQA